MTGPEGAGTATPGAGADAGRERAAARLARRHAPAGADVDSPGIGPRLDRLGDELRALYRALASSRKIARSHPRVVEWMLDNEHLIRRSARQMEEDLPAGFHRRLPRLSTGEVRIEPVAGELVRSEEHRLDDRAVVSFVEAYQDVRPLRISELWALPTFLRLTLLERLARAVGELTGEDPDAGPSPVPEISRAALVENCVSSLRWIDETDWERLFEAVSRVDRVLREDPSGHYGRVDGETRDRYRKAVEELARGCEASELEIARTAVEHGRAAGADAPDRVRHVGHHLIGAGRKALEERLGARPTPRTRRIRWIREHAGLLYFGAQGLMTAALAAAAGAAVANGPAPLVAAVVAAGLVPALTVANATANWLFTHLVPPRRLPKLSGEEGVPSGCETMVVVPCLLSDRTEVDELLERLEVHYQGNDEPELSFALLTDFADAPREEMQGDEELLERARRGIRRLNRRHGGEDRRPFHLLHRPRRWNPSEGCWMGRERKRGKLEDFNRLVLEGDDAPFSVRIGDPDAVASTRFVITLDADTRMPPGTAARLIGVMAHPLNLPVFGEGSGVTAGYTVLQPRLETMPIESERTPFGRLYGGDTALDLYSRVVSDVYMDLFGEGIYAGKGIYHVEAFERSLRGRVPENALLSHDLFEGSCGRAGLVSDLMLLEESPVHVVSHMRRFHRWVRGDWQWLPWLLPRVPAAHGRRVDNWFSALDRWKFADNLRRSLVAPSLLLLLLVGWLTPHASPWVWTAAALGVAALPTLLGAAVGTTRRLLRMAGRPRDGRGGGSAGWRSRLLHAARRTRDLSLRWLLLFAFLPHQAFVAADAVVRTLWRLLVSRRGLLEWTAAARAAREAARGSGWTRWWRRMPAGPLCALAAGAVVGLRPEAAGAVAVLALPWLASPEIARLVSRPRRRRRERLGEDDRRRLRLYALRTWLFFERFVDSDDHWLPPDHYDERPGGPSGSGRIARRTSPTNIGMFLISAVAARDLGHLGPLSLEALLRNTAESMDALDRHRGHFFNWYGTRDLDVLEPRYVSTVDSGNLLAALLVTAESLDGLGGEPALGPARAEGLRDTLRVLEEALAELGASPPWTDGLLATQRRRLAEAAGDGASLAAELARMEEEFLPELADREVELAGGEEGAERFPGVSLETSRELRIWTRRVAAAVAHARRDVRRFHPWLELVREPAAGLDGDGSDHGGAVGRARAELLAALRATPALGEVPDHAEEIRARLERLRTARDGPPRDDVEGRWERRLDEAAASAAREAEALLERTAELSAVFRRWAEEMNFGFLYDRRRRIFHIGYDVGADALDVHHYDLLASEARLASYLAVARGEVPTEHWLHLGRPFAPGGATPLLLSWSGTMFEYLLPAHFLRTPEDSLLAKACRGAVERQRRYGRRHGMPWGVSESAYARDGDDAAYGYRAFGVPELSLRRDPEARRVVAPYATFLALPFAPREALANLERLEEAGMLGRYGFYEALDFGTGEDGAGDADPPRRVRSYMAHHQGMSLLALANHLLDGAMVERLHDSAGAEAAVHLLHERLPWRVPARGSWLPAERPGPRLELPGRLEHREVDPEARWPEVGVLSNGTYRTVVTARGGGASFRGDRALTPWVADSTRDACGSWLYLVDEEDRGGPWSATAAPVPDGAPPGRAVFAAHQAEFHREVGGAAIHTRIAVAPDEDVEVRRVRITNRSDRPRRLRIASFREVALDRPEEHRRHPAYSRLFVEAEVEEGGRLLLFHRRPRAPDDAAGWLAHGVLADVDAGAVRSGVEREAFLGRGRTSSGPAALDPAAGEHEAGEAPRFPLDPAAWISVPVPLEPGESREVTFLTAAADERAEALRAVESCRSPARVEAVFGRARERCEELLTRHELEPEDMPALGRLLSALLLPRPGLRPPARELASNRLGQRDLWPFALSGDLPILLVRLDGRGDLSLLSRLLRGHALWRAQGLEVDLVVVDRASSGYEQPLRDRVLAALERLPGPTVTGQPGGVHLLQGRGMEPETRRLLAAAAAVVLDGDAGSLEEQLAALDRTPVEPPPFVQVASAPLDAGETPALERSEGLWRDNGWGGFRPDGRSYLVRCEPGDPTPAPWANVVAGEGMGFLTSESGLGCTWSVNAQERRLTPWRNDPVSDPPSEAVYLRDEETADVWTPTPLPVGPGSRIEAVHEPGATTWRCRSHGLAQRLRVHLAEGLPVKVAELELRNLRARTRRVTVTYYAPWVLGGLRDREAPWVVPGYDAENEALLARNPRDRSYAGRVAFLASDRPPHGLTADRTEFLGPGGDPARPAALERIGLSGRVEAGRDPCAALQVHLDIPEGGTRTVRFFLGEGADREGAASLLDRLRDGDAASGIAATRDAWDERLSGLEVATPDGALDRAVNRWLPYQTLSSRLLGRTSLYQSGGAYGFRDQLQDVTALLAARPGLASEQLLRSARRQFREGDVLHWWHPPDEGEPVRGVRTRCSDDLLWLPWTAAEYVRATGDLAILDRRLPFLEGEELAEGEAERYGEFREAGPPASLWDHCLRAVERAATEGPRGLPLIGAGDWNDGMNRVGAGGRGESVWLGWFLCAVLSALEPLARARGEDDRAGRLRLRRLALAERLDRHGWDGDRYLRAFYDDGTPLGTSEAAEARIDAISQAWAVLSDAADRGRARRAMDSAWDELVREEAELALLLAPPFSGERRDPGYIAAYPPGVRENGGQYAHAAAWLGMAAAALGDGGRAHRIFRFLNPIDRARTRERARRYRTEPYAMAADVYGVEPHRGRGGWSWYTGSAAWARRLAVESILGLRLRGGRLRFDPCLPPRWPGAELTLRRDGTVHRVRIENPDGTGRGVRLVELDGRPVEDGWVPRAEDGAEHRVRVVLGGGEPAPPGPPWRDPFGG